MAAAAILDPIAVAAIAEAAFSVGFCAKSSPSTPKRPLSYPIEWPAPFERRRRPTRPPPSLTHVHVLLVGHCPGRSRRRSQERVPAADASGAASSCCCCCRRRSKPFCHKDDGSHVTAAGRRWISVSLSRDSLSRSPARAATTALTLNIHKVLINIYEDSWCHRIPLSLARVSCVCQWTVFHHFVKCNHLF